MDRSAFLAENEINFDVENLAVGEGGAVRLFLKSVGENVRRKVSVLVRDMPVSNERDPVLTTYKSATENGF